ncbi:Synaptonemal complex protein ZEP1 [Camellia lanceoleosa]|uniref:Synaptonemal complex protein ZEP1 n=1 Tax=Camellia lanceoleosa TaxID=1840588 RepID=A0ACC0GKW3_9ERIC|nr:Synaptonemal complex protein ZEP1 [Camellia lanceoleosa]
MNELYGFDGTSLDAKKQYDLMLESKQLELSRHLKELSQKNDQAINDIRRRFEVGNLGQVNIKKEKADKAVQEMESKCDQKLVEYKKESRQKSMSKLTWVAACQAFLCGLLGEQQEVKEAEDKETLVDTEQETEPEPKEEEVPPLISTDQTEDLLGLNEINPKAVEVKESNALALAIVPLGVNIVLNSHHHQSDENT